MAFLGPSGEGRSSSKTLDPVWAKWQAMREPITPEPSTATRWMRCNGISSGAFMKRLVIVWSRAQAIAQGDQIGH